MSKDAVGDYDKRQSETRGDDDKPKRAPPNRRRRDGPQIIVLRRNTSCSRDYCSKWMEAPFSTPSPSKPATTTKTTARRHHYCTILPHCAPISNLLPQKRQRCLPVSRSQVLLAQFMILLEGEPKIFYTRHYRTVSLDWTSFASKPARRTALDPIVSLT